MVAARLTEPAPARRSGDRAGRTIAALFDAATTPRLVLKVGSALLVGRDGLARSEWVASLGGEIAEARLRGQEVIVVSSGAIALGAHRLALPQGGRASLADAQAAAAVGQIALAGLWAASLGEHGLTAAQLLLTLEDLEDRRRYLNAAATLARLVETGAVPVVNENDSVATEEIRFGDNDRLAARLAQAARADAVVLLSDVDGLYDRNPSDPQARLLPLVKEVTDDLVAAASATSGSGLGRGGMVAKLHAARIAQRGGITLAILNGTHERPLARALASGLGTLVQPAKQDKARKAWLGARQRMAGALIVDEGCAAALLAGKSVLAAGVRAVEGAFERGELIAIRDEGQRVLGKGLAEYDAREVAVLKGHRSQDHEALLGYPPRAAVIHRDHLVLA